LHILFWREHNRVARLLYYNHPEWRDDELFEAARRYVIATIQHITFEEFLFWLLARPFPDKDYYDPTCDPRIHIFFSTVANRYGHSEIGDWIISIANGNYGKFASWHLYDHYFDPYFPVDIDICDIFEGMSRSVSKSNDHKISDSIRNYLFMENGQVKYDLFAIDIQRGRNHYIPDYNHARISYGLEPLDTWEDFDSLDERLGENARGIKQDLAKIYRNPWEADAIIAGMAADWVRTPETLRRHDVSNLGELFEAAIISQFQRSRVGDRFWYTRNLDIIDCDRELEPVLSRTLADVIRDNFLRGREDCFIPDNVWKVYL